MINFPPHTPLQSLPAKIDAALDVWKIQSDGLLHSWESLFDPEYPKLYQDRSGFPYQKTEESLAEYHSQCNKVCRLIRRFLDSYQYRDDLPDQTLLTKYHTFLRNRSSDFVRLALDLAKRDYPSPFSFIEIQTTIEAHLENFGTFSEDDVSVQTQIRSNSPEELERPSTPLPDQNDHASMATTVSATPSEADEWSPPGSPAPDEISSEALFDHLNEEELPARHPNPTHSPTETGEEELQYRGFYDRDSDEDDEVEIPDFAVLPPSSQNTTTTDSSPRSLRVDLAMPKPLRKVPSILHSLNQLGPS